MEKDSNNSVNYSSSSINDEDEEKSIVGKFKSIINSTPISKWFRKREDSSKSTVRRRDDEAEDDEVRQMQPPSKRAKLPEASEQNNSVIFNKLDSITAVDTSEAYKTVNHFPEPVAGPSGINSRKFLSSATTVSINSVKNTYSRSELFNGHKDSDSEESTSGYSSVARIGSKEHVCQSQESSKQTSPLQNEASNTRSLFQSPNPSMTRSMFAERTWSPNANTSMTSRRPSFNASTFGSPNFVDKTITTEKIINSPFYNGRTIYGGASAYGRRLGRSAKDLRTSLKKSIQIKPVNKTNENGNMMLGKTARRILETLEQYSSPVNDAKKIPVTSKRFRPDGYISPHVGANPYMARGNETPSNKELQVPTVSDLLKMKQKMKLQQSTEVVRQIAISSKSNLNTEIPDRSATRIEVNKPETVEKDSSKDQKLEETKAVEKQMKPTAPSLPFSTLPKFDFGMSTEQTKNKSPKKPANGFSFMATPFISGPVNSEPPPVAIRTDATKKTEEPSVNATTKRSFKFSDPLVISENFKSVIAINNFKFSEPLCKLSKSGTPKSPSKDKTEEQLGNDAIELGGNQASSGILNTNTTNPPLNDGKNNFGGQFIISTDKWECGVCLIRNKDTDTKCVACTAPKPLPKPAAEKVTAPPPISAYDKFKMPGTVWECSVCLVRNENSRDKCIACQEPKTKSVAGLPLPGFGTQFSTPTNTWECTTCMIRNKEELTKCAACETPKMGKTSSNSLSTLFKIKEDEWECALCMVRNKSSNIKCQCCDAAKPGSSSKSVLTMAASSDKPPLPKFNFGIDKAVVNSFTFGVPASQAVTLPKPAVDPSVVFGDKAKATAPAAKFSFGIPAEPQKESKPAETVKPAEVKPSTVLPVVAPPAAEKDQTSNDIAKPAENVPAAATLTVFKDKEAAVKPATTIGAKSDVPAKPVFSFGAPSTTTDKPAVKVGTATKEQPPKLFSFGAKPVVPTIAPAPQSVNNAPPATETSKPLASTAPAFTFSANKTTSNAAPSLFGTKLPAPNNGFSFTGTSSFGNTKQPSSTDAAPKNAAEAKPFAFGASAPTGGEPASKMPTFSFGPPKTSQEGPAQAPLFSFGSGKPASFSFGAAKTETAPATTFNAPSSGSVFGANNATFSFGSNQALQNNNGQKAGFSFGAAAAPAAPSTGFNFAAAAPAPVAGGFNFSEAAAGFGASKPTFNFTDGSVTAFTAPPSTEGGLAAPRKIKKALRRGQR